MHSTKQQLLVFKFLMFPVFCLVFWVFAIKTTKFQLNLKVSCLKTWFYDYPKSKITKIFSHLQSFKNYNLISNFLNNLHNLNFVTPTPIPTLYSNLQDHIKQLQHQLLKSQLPTSNFQLPTSNFQLTTSNSQLTIYNSILKCTIQNLFWTSNL